jgi:hypothetical protein
MEYRKNSQLERFAILSLEVCQSEHVTIHAKLTFESSVELSCSGRHSAGGRYDLLKRAQDV